MTEFRLRIGFAKAEAAIWLSHLEVVRAMERCVRRSGLPYAVSQGFSPHLKHSFSAALPVGTGSTGEYMDVELASLVPAEQALASLKAVQHRYLPILSAKYAPKNEDSLQIFLNHALYLIGFEGIHEPELSELFKRLSTSTEITVHKKGGPKAYNLRNYLVEASLDQGSLKIALLSRPEGSLRPEVILETVAKPDLELKIRSITRIALSHQDLPPMV